MEVQSLSEPYRRSLELVIIKKNLKETRLVNKHVSFKKTPKDYLAVQVYICDCLLLGRYPVLNLVHKIMRNTNFSHYLAKILRIHGFFEDLIRFFLPFFCIFFHVFFRGSLHLYLVFFFHNFSLDFSLILCKIYQTHET